MNNIYKLQAVCDNPVFEGFGFAKFDMEFINRIWPGKSTPDQRYWRQPSFKDWWPTPKVGGRVGSYNDCPGINLHFPAFSRRACDVLREFLEPNGELLPLDSEVGEYYFYNCQKLSDALDLEQSKYTWLRKHVRVLDPEYYVFKEDELADLSIFMLYVWPNIYVTDTFKDRVEQAGLLGFDFIKVYPFPTDVYWKMENKILKAEQQQQTNSLKQQTIAVLLPLTGKAPTADENLHLAQLEDSLDHILKVNNPQQTYFGNFEGHDLYRNSYRMFLTCPDADRLFEKIQPWLQSLDWPATVKCVRRYGSMYDVKAKQKTKSFPPKI